MLYCMLLLLLSPCAVIALNAVIDFMYYLMMPCLYVYSGGCVK